MVYEIVHREVLYRVYSASTVSFAYATKLSFDCIRIFLPLVLIFATHGLWKKTGRYYERPQVSFGGRYLLVMGSAEEYYFTSTLPVLNRAESSHFVASQLSYETTSISVDQDEFHVHITMPRSNMSSLSLTYFIFLNYSLKYHSDVKAEVALCDSVQLTSPSSSLTVLGRLAADQKLPFRWRELYQLFDPDRFDSAYFTPEEIMGRIARQPFSARIDRKMQLQNSDEEGAGHFRLTLRIVVADDEFTYRTDVWELLKWAAVQYVTALLVVNYLLSGFLSSLFRNRLIEAVSCCNPLQ